MSKFINKYMEKFSKLLGINPKGLKFILVVIFISTIIITGSAFAIENWFDNAFTKLQPNVNTQIVVNVYNNTGDKVKVEQEGNEINVHVDKGKENKESEVVKNDSHKQGIVIAESGLNIRVRDDIESDKIGALEYGEEIKIIEESGNFYKIDHGYVYKDYVKLEE